MKRWFEILLTGWLVVLSSCSQKASDRSYKIMLKGLLRHDVPEVDALRAARDTDAIFLDAREKVEYDVSQIRGARWVGYKDFAVASVKDISRDQPIIVYCSVGYRSEKIAEKLVASGYRSVKNLYGGIFSWVNEGYPVYRNGVQTNNVHAYSSFWGKWLRKGSKVYDAD